MTETDIDKIISELPDLPKSALVGRRGGTHCYSYNYNNVALYKYEVLLYTGELIKCHSYIIHGNNLYKTSLASLLKNGCTFLGAGIVHKVLYD